MIFWHRHTWVETGSWQDSEYQWYDIETEHWFPEARTIVYLKCSTCGQISENQLTGLRSAT